MSKSKVRSLFKKATVLAAIVALMAALLPSMTAIGAGAATGLTVDAASQLGKWNRFYEESIGTCHPITILESAFGRNIIPALEKGYKEAGFKKFRAHGILDKDMGVYREVNGKPVYDWTKFDQVYDKVTAIGMRPIVELSFMPPDLAATTAEVFWYNGAPGKISPPKDFNKWRDLCKAVVEHCEKRYGAEEVRKNWYFEVWNEPDLSGFWSSSESMYYKLYDYAVEGVKAADSKVKVGGPSISATHMKWMERFLKHIKTGKNFATGKTGARCDFITYHRYSTDEGFGSTKSDPNAMVQYHNAIVDYAKKYGFTGEIMCTEWAPSANAETNHSDDETSASFIAKTIHMFNDNGNYQMPFAYSWWCLSDIFEEWDPRPKTAYDGSFGLLLRGDPKIKDSYDVEKPSFNAFKLLHMMGDTMVSLKGGNKEDGVNGVATLSKDKNSMQVLVYNHIKGASADPLSTDNVNLTINNIPFASGNVKIEHYCIDYNTSNSYHVWEKMGSPSVPTAEQWAVIKSYSKLAYKEPAVYEKLSGKTLKKSFKLNKYGVSLFIISKVTGQTPKAQPLPEMPAIPTPAPAPAPKDGEIKLTGKAFGTKPYAAGSEFDKAVDGSLFTAFDALEEKNVYTGIDLGEGKAKRITRILYWPRAKTESRMINSIFQGSNTGQDSGYVNLFTVKENPLSGWNEAVITDIKPYRYIRYFDGHGGHANIAEMVIYGK